MATKRLAGRGRAWIAVALFSFVLVASGVIYRRSVGYAGARRIDELDRNRTQLEGRQGRLERDIRDLSSRVKLGPVAEQRLQMHTAPDSQVILLPRPPR